MTGLTIPPPRLGWRHPREVRLVPTRPATALALALLAPVTLALSRARAEALPSSPARETRTAGAFAALHGKSEPAPRIHRVGTAAVVTVHSEAPDLPPAFLPALAAAARELETVFGPLTKPLAVRIGGPSTSMTVAYNPAEDAVIFPGHRQARDFGLHDHDRLRHEVFHAWVARAHPHLVTPEALDREETRTLHEAAADFFAWLADDDGDFGEDYTSPPRALRQYRTRLRFPLVQGSHARGNALTSYWIGKRRTLSDLAAGIARGCETPECMVDTEDRREFGPDPATRPEIAVSVEGLPASSLGRYRIAPGAVLRLEANPVLAAEGNTLTTAFATPTGTPVAGWRFEPIETGPALRRFRIRPAPDAPPAKVVVRHLQAGVVVGFDVVYLSARGTDSLPTRPDGLAP